MSATGGGRAAGTAAVAFVVALVSLGLSTPEVSAAEASETDALQGADCVDYTSLKGKTGSQRDLRNALRQRHFTIQGKRSSLMRPVDWDADPFRSRSWRAKLHNWSWMDVLLVGYQETGDRAALELARDLALDWIDQNPPSPDISWGDKVTGDRAGFLAYIARASGCRGLLSDEQAAAMLDSLQTHGEFLSDPSNYSRSNHGLFMDAGLMLIGKYEPFLADAPRWEKLGRRRIERSYSRSVDRKEGVHLEHSPGYHFLTLGLLQAILRLTDDRDPDLLRLRDRMMEVAGWFTMPDGRPTELGDTNFRRIPDWAIQRAAGLEGISPTRRSGYGIVKAQGGYLSVAAGHHSQAHKQADELTFELFDRGRRIIRDTGRYGTARDPTDPAKVAAQEFTLSSQAHSVLVVDGQSFDTSAESFYGSAIRATGQGAGWYAIEGTNPLVARQGVDHRRLFLYRPSQALFVVDIVRSDTPHSYTRYLQLDPDIRAKASGRTVELHADDFRGTIHDARTPWDTGTPELVRGQESPLLGFYSQHGFAGFKPRYAVAYTSQGDDVDHVAALRLGSSAPLKAELTTTSRRRVRLRVGSSNLTVTRDKETLSVSGDGPLAATATARTAPPLSARRNALAHVVAAALAVIALGGLTAWRIHRMRSRRVRLPSFPPLGTVLRAPVQGFGRAIGGAIVSTVLAVIVLVERVRDASRTTAGTR